MNLENMNQNTGKMILQFAVPSILAMVLTALITIADGFFIGNYVGKEGIVAVNLGLPILYIYLAVGIMIGVGGVAIAGILLGAGENEKSNGVFNQTVMTTLVVTLVLTMLTYFSIESLIRLLNMDVQVVTTFKSYYTIMIFVYSLMMVNASMGMFIRCEGNPALFMLVSLLTVVTNILLDFVFIAILNYGIEGVAYASMISVAIGTICMVMYFLKKTIVFKFRAFTFSKDVLKNTLLNGSSELIGQLSMSISMFAYNWVILKTAGVNGVAAFTIIGYAAYLFNMVIVGFGQGASPLISFSFGGSDFMLSRKIRRQTNQFVLGAGIIAIAILSLSMEGYSSVFVQNESVKNLVQTGLAIFMISFLFSGINTITSFYFTSIGRAKESAIISASRGLVLLLFCIFTLPMLCGMIGVWLVAPVTEGITLILSLLFIKQSDLVF